MQPEPNESSPRIHPPTIPVTPSNASQYGFHPQQLPSADLRNVSEENAVEPEWSSDAGNATELPSIESSPVRQQLGRLNLYDRTENRPKPSYQRIAEYENALAPSPLRKEDEGPAFKVIKKKGSRLDGPQLDNFPNGMLVASLLRRISFRFFTSNYLQRFLPTSYHTCQQIRSQPWPLFRVDSTH